MSDAKRIKSLAITEEYNIKQVLSTLKSVNQLPFAQLLDMLKHSKSKLETINIMILLKDCLKKEVLEREIYNIETNTLQSTLTLGEILSRLFDISL